MQHRPRRILPVIVVSQLAGTSLWFAGNAVLPDLQASLGLPDSVLGDMTAAVQLGFIAGTLAFAVLAISDRYSPRLTFLACALVVGTALPHLIRALGQSLPWQTVMLSVSAIAAFGGLLMFWLVPDGPFLSPGARFNPGSLATVFRSPGFRSSSFGYFGHMWELYAFWAFVPPALAAYAARSPAAGFDIPLLSFAVIAAGAIGSIAGGYAALRLGSARVGFAQLMASGLCCLLSPVLFELPPAIFLPVLLFWGAVVVGDSAQFSALNARYAPPDQVGSALTIANCIGFGISIVSIQLLNRAAGSLPAQYLFLLLVPGPLLGLWSLRPLLRAES
jgi:predicted MFS family arabinose efflux permease